MPCSWMRMDPFHSFALDFTFPIPGQVPGQMRVQSLASRCSLAVLLLLLLLLLLSKPGLCQQTMPFPGNGEEPDQPITVFASSYIDRLMYIDDKNYEFQAQVFVYLSWVDPRARKAVAANMARLSANSSQSCKLPCQLYPQNQQNPATGCCDDVWLPYVSFPTLKLLSQDRVLRSGVNIEPDSDAVAYWSIIMGTFMASFDLRAFPFDAQRLHVQMEVPGWAGGHVRLKPSSGGTRMFNTNPDGDALSGWQVKSVRMATYSLPLCQRYTVSSSQPSAADDPVPLVSALLYTDKQVKARPGTCGALLDAHRQDPAFLVYTRQNLDGSDTLQDRPLNVTGVTCTIVIRRFVAQWIMSAILPIVASTWLGFVVFLLPRDCMNSRLGAVMTIFVALAAIQFVVSQDLPNSSYMTALQQLIAAGYVTLILIGIESVVIWWITTYHITGKRLAAHLAARKQYEVELKSELAALKAKLAALLAEQERQHGPKVRTSHSFASIASMKALTMRRLSKSARDVHVTHSASPARTASGGSSEERSAAAAIAVKAADMSARKSSGWQALREAQQMPPSVPAELLLPVHSAGASGDPDAAAASDVPVACGRTDQLKDTQQVIQQVSKLEQQLAGIHAQDAQLRQHESSYAAVHHSSHSPLASRQDSIAALGFGAPQVAGMQLPLSAPMHAGAAAAVSAAATGKAAAAGDAVMEVGVVDHLHHAEHPQDQHTGCIHDWELCTRIRVFFALLKENETLTDQLAFQINKWIAILQFLAYNIAAVLIFAVNWALYHKS